MRLLLDTHVLLWMLGDPASIPTQTRARLQDRDNELVISAVTPFEIANKHRLGKLPDGGRIVAAYASFLEQLGAVELAITGHHGIVGGQLVWDHRDPFDRILAAQSISESIPLVTSDAAFLSIGEVSTVWG